MIGGGALYVHEQVDAVEQRAAQAAAVAREVHFAAGTALLLTRVSARTGIGRRDQHEARRIHGRVARPHDCHATVLQWLAQRLERRTREL